MFERSRHELTDETRRGLPGSFIELSAGVTHYDLRGDDEGQTVVLIHGNAAPSVTWDHTVDALTAAGFRVLRYDLFGHGFSDRPDLPTYDRRLYNEQLSDLLSRLGITDPVLVVGSSQGGSIGACFAAQNPGKVAKLALLAPFFDELPGSDSPLYRVVLHRPWGELIWALMGDRRGADLSDAMVDVAARAELQPRVLEQYAYPGKHHAVLANLRGDALTDATECYRGVGRQGIPVLLAWGTGDQKLPVATMHRLRDLLPGIEAHELVGPGHLAHYEAPAVVNPMLVRFLTGSADAETGESASSSTRGRP